MYVDHYFPAEHKARVRQMAENIIAAFSKRIDQLDWMAPATRAQAHAKLKTLYVGIGYPDKWRSYAGLDVVAGDAFGNAQRAEAFRTATQFAKLRQKVDRTEWAMSPQTINAVNMPMQNAINIPAGYLQAPFFDPTASDAQNYGAIGTTIGHEVSHSFDDQGAQFDAQGRLRDWWTKEDLAHFKAASSKLVAQFNAYKPFPDLAVNGNLTLSENLADLAGMGAAYDAYRGASATRPTPPATANFHRQRPEKPQQVERAGTAPAHLVGRPFALAIPRGDGAQPGCLVFRFDVKAGAEAVPGAGDRVKVWWIC